MMNMKNKAESKKKRALLLCSLTFMLIALLISACTKQQAETYQKAPNMADEAAAVRALQNIFRAETQYMNIHEGNYGTFDDLVKDSLLDARFAGNAPTLLGYVFTIKVKPDSGEGSSYSVNADLKDATALGGRYLYIDSTSNVVRANAKQKASVSDPPLQ